MLNMRNTSYESSKLGAEWVLGVVSPFQSGTRGTATSSPRQPPHADLDVPALGGKNAMSCGVLGLLELKTMEKTWEKTSKKHGKTWKKSLKMHGNP